MRVLGVSAFYHDSAAALVHEGRIIAAAQEERFSRRRQDAEFPWRAIAWCFDSTRTRLADVDCVVFYDKPLLKFERLLETAVGHAPRGSAAFVAAMRVWLKDKLFTKKNIARHLAAIAGVPRTQVPPILFTEHHQAHAASAFYPSPFQQAAVLCLDGVGEWATTSAWRGEGNRLERLWEIHFPHSLGLLYSAFTHYLGFRINSGEYKVMGLAPYGNPTYKERILRHLIEVKEDGAFRLDTRHFGYLTSLRMTNEHFDELFEGPARIPESPLTQRHADLARSVQEVTEEVILRLARTIRKETGERNLCLAGGVALNCIANTKLQREGVFDRIWIQPAAGDAGGAIGAAYAGWFERSGLAREADDVHDSMAGAFLGPRFPSSDACSRLDILGARYCRRDEGDLLRYVAEMLADGRLAGWFQGAMEFGPRALGARSILADPRSFEVRERVNRAVKARESFRPFAASVTAERAHEFFGVAGESPYMLLLGSQTKERGEGERLWSIDDWDRHDFLRVPSCRLPAVIHADGSTRLQTVTEVQNPRFYSLLRAFEAVTGVPALLNTSFNVRGEPIVCTPEEAYACFMNTALDLLVVEDLVLDKREQPPWRGGPQVFEPD